MRVVVFLLLLLLPNVASQLQLPPSDAADVLLLAFSAYCGSAVEPSFDCFWCSKLTAPFSVVGTFGQPNSSGFGFVGIFDQQNRIVVSIRGTDNLAGWIKDAEFTQTAYPGAPNGVKVHEGFFNISQHLRPQILALFNKAQARCGGSCHVLVTGHSLGASLATLATLALAQDIDKDVSVQILNFGSPRVFNPAGAAWFATNHSLLGIESIVRVTSMHDPVPHLPPHDFIEHYMHVPQEVWEISNSPLKFVQCSPTNGEDPTCSDSVSAWKMDILDHARYMGYNALDGIPHGCLYTDH